MPTADNCLAITQESLEGCEKKIVRKLEALKELIRQHNDKYNTTGQTFRTNDGAPVKLAPPGAGSTKGEPEDCSPEQTYDSIDAVQDGNIQTMPGSPAEYTLHASSNKLLLQAHEDGVVGNDHPLCHIWGGVSHKQRGRRGTQEEVEPDAPGCQQHGLHGLLLRPPPLGACIYHGTSQTGGLRRLP